MPLKKAIICSGISLFCINALSAQEFTNHKPLQKVVGFQEYQQRKWRMHHLPKNSYFLLSSSEYMSALDTVPEWMLSRGGFFCGYTGSSDENSLVPTNLQARKLEYCHWQKESWWRDNSQETISSFLKNVLSNIDHTRQ